MCWVGDTSKFKTAEEDIPIYKVMEIAGDEHFLSYFRRALYKKDTLVTSEIRIDGYNNEVTRALHSYSIKNTKIKTYSPPTCGELTLYISIRSFKGNSIGYYFGSKLVLGYIPRGSMYCENDIGEIVSNQLVMTKICSEEELKKLSK